MPRMKEQKKFPGNELNEIEKSNLLDTGFKTMLIKMLKKLVKTKRRTQQDLKRYP